MTAKLAALAIVFMTLAVPLAAQDPASERPSIGATSGNGTVLWRGLEAGMTAAQVVAVLKEMGIEATVKIDKKKNIEYVKESGGTISWPSDGTPMINSQLLSGLSILGNKFTPTLYFAPRGLKRLVLSGPNACGADDQLRLFEAYSGLVSQKYGTPNQESRGLISGPSGTARMWKKFVDGDLLVEVSLSLVPASLRNYGRTVPIVDPISCPLSGSIWMSYESRSSAMLEQNQAERQSEEALKREADKL